MLLHMMELRGKVNHRMIKKAQFGNIHFDDGLNFLSCEIDKSTGQVGPLPYERRLLTADG
jgi:serine/threonine-protein kinase PRP4